MAKSKKNRVLEIFYTAFSLYCKHLKEFLSYMTFPIIGQVAGIVVIFVLNYHFLVNLDLIQKYLPVFIKPAVIITSVIILLLPGLCIMLKAFWEYLVAYGAINSMAENMIKSKKIYDIEAHTLVISHRKFAFAGLWLLYSLFIFLFINPLLWILGGLVFVFFALVFQVFVLEPEKNIFMCFHKSFILVKQKYFETLLMLLLISCLTYFIIPELIRFLCSISGIVTIFANLIQNIVVLNLQIYIDKLNEILLTVNQPTLTVIDISKLIVLSFIGWIISSYLLPLRTLACYLWYKSLNKKYLAKFKKNKTIDVQV